MRCSVLSLVILLGFAARSVAAANVPVCGAITTSTTWTKNNVYKVNCVTTVQPGTTLTIEPGTVVEAKGRAELEPAVAIIVHRGARIIARGTADEPITFTTQENIDHYWTQPRADLVRGLWSGLVILGRAPVRTNPTQSEGVLDEPSCPKCEYGGDVELDSSGRLEYVRVWYAGYSSGFRAGLTLAGAGSGTIVRNVDVAWHLGDGIQVHGGGANFKHISSAYNGAAAVRLNEGYQGLMQYVFAIASKTGGEALAVESSSDDRRTRPKVYNALLVGSVESTAAAVVIFRGGSGGEYANIVVTNVHAKGAGVSQEGCGTVVSTHVRPKTGSDDSRTLWWSERNVIVAGNAQGGVAYSGGCGGGLSKADRADPKLTDLPSSPEFDYRIDPRPQPESDLFEYVEETPNDPHDFFAFAVFRGAFGMSLKDVWIGKYTWLATHNGLTDRVARAHTTTVVTAEGKKTGFDDVNVRIGVGVLIAVVVAAIAAAVTYYVRFKRIEAKYEVLIGKEMESVVVRPKHGSGAITPMSANNNVL